MEKRKKRLWGYHQAVMVYEIMLWLLTTAAVISTGILFIPKLAGVRPYVILSSSMEPAIRTGSLIFVKYQRQEGRGRRYCDLSAWRKRTGGCCNS